MSDLGSKLDEKKPLDTWVHPDGTGNLMGIWSNMFSQASQGSEVCWVETPRDVYRFMQQPAYSDAINRGVKVKVLLVQANLPEQETFKMAIQHNLTIVQAYDRKLHEINRLTGLDGVINYIHKTWNFVFQSKTEKLKLEDAYRLALDWKDEFFSGGKVKYPLDLKVA